MTLKTILTACTLLLFLVSCNSTSEKENKTTTSRLTEHTDPLKSLAIGDKVPNDKVCMVNDAYMGVEQIPVPVSGKTYYGCCDMCVDKLNSIDEARIAIDPYSGNPIDKSEAFIVLSNSQGSVTYFESESNYKAFTKRL
ncbi:hypothetical protein G3567_09805 [Psychroflexus sp. YR1-1]|uniref:MlpB protein n=1 Tax=Psychroflexus aurantiacus TaxID=2709310 RepID=A0A6B3R5W1_9FLAO|nr:hypothetical protein [Psychroflexus aurantiacus]NEV94435.1 hypothetical protein [Psychroflexus aurantiacus]